jgi:tetratricopeptide (TPR) repeat protein
MEQTIFDSLPRSGASYKLTPVPDSQTLFVIFSATGKSDGRFDFGKIAPGLPVTTLLVNDPVNGWYQHGVPGLGHSIDETCDLIGEIADDLGVGTICCMGSSMGAYAALLYGARLNARILAFAPDTRLQVPWSYSRKMMPEGAVPVVPDLIDTLTRMQGVAQIVVGELDAMDLWHVARLPALPHVYQASLPGVGHGIPRVLKENGHLDKVLADFLSGRPLDPAVFDGKALTIRGLSRTLWLALDAYNTDRTDEAERLSRKALALHPASDCAKVLLARCLNRAADYKTAVALLQDTSTQARRDSDVAVLFGQISRKLRDPAPALPLLQRAVDSDPRNDRLHYELGMCHWGAGNKAEAIAALNAAHLLRPDHAHYASQLAKLGPAAG